MEQSCEACVWMEHENTQVVQTSWAAMALIYGKYPHTEPIVKAVELVMSRQLPVCGLVTLRVRVTLTLTTSGQSQDGSWAGGH